MCMVDYIYKICYLTKKPCEELSVLYGKDPRFKNIPRNQTL